MSRWLLKRTILLSNSKQLSTSNPISPAKTRQAITSMCAINLTHYPVRCNKD